MMINLLAGAVALALSGCAVGPVIDSPSPDRSSEANRLALSIGEQPMGIGESVRGSDARRARRRGVGRQYRSALSSPPSGHRRAVPANRERGAFVDDGDQR